MVAYFWALSYSVFYLALCKPIQNARFTLGKQLKFSVWLRSSISLWFLGNLNTKGRYDYST
jgi:hypothetical protein